jgi:lipopolysaccharide transport system permease protein
MDSIPAETLIIETPELTGEPARRPLLTIRPMRGWLALDLRELWRFRDLALALASRDVKLRYKQTALGVIWVVLQPLMAAGVFSFVFGKVAKMPSDGIPYFIFSYAGLLGWNLFSSVTTKVGGSLVGNAHLISKVFFPRLILPLSSLASALLDFAVAAGMLAVLMVIFHVAPGWGLLLMPAWIAMLLMLATGVGLFAASLMVSYRDVAYVMPVAMQILLYACPIAYAVSAVPENLRFWYNLNPLSSIFEAVRWSVFGVGTLSIPTLGGSALLAVVVLLLGMFSFKRMERKFADVI